MKNTATHQRSNSQKRGMDDEEGFIVVKKKKVQGISGKGSFKVTIVIEDNYQTFVSNVALQIKNT